MARRNLLLGGPNSKLHAVWQSIGFYICDLRANTCIVHAEIELNGSKGTTARRFIQVDVLLCVVIQNPRIAGTEGHACRVCINTGVFNMHKQAGMAAKARRHIPLNLNLLWIVLAGYFWNCCRADELVAPAL